VPSKLRPVHAFTRDIDDVTPANRDLVERALFLALARDRCETHARYSVDRFALTTSRGRTTVHVTRCCAPDDDTLRMTIDFAPVVAMQNREDVLKLTQVTPGAPVDLDASAALGFRRRRRGKAITLEATLALSGVERLSEEQVTRLRELIDAAAAKGELTCPVHRKSAIEAVHVVQEKDASVVDLVVCCADVHAAVFLVQSRIVDDALLSGPVVAIEAGKYTKKKRVKIP
jgi:hypothetical protein